MIPEALTRPPSSFGTSFPLLVFTVSVLFLLRKLIPVIWRWLVVWKALRPVPGPWDTVPFWYFAKELWSRWKGTYNRDIFVEIFDIMRATAEMYKDRNFKVYVGLLPVVVLQTPDAVETLVVDHPKKPYLYNFFSDVFGPMNLVSVNGELWRYKRKMLTPAFHFKILERFVKAFNEQGNVLCSIVEQMADSDQLVPIQKLATRCAIDVIAETAMGVRLGVQAREDNAYANAIIRLTCGIAGRVFRPWLWPGAVFFSTKDGCQFQEDIDILAKTGRAVLKERWEGFKPSKDTVKTDYSDETSKCRMALLDILLDRHTKDKAFSLEQIRQDVDSFIAVGHETTALTLSWLVYLLSLHPEAQKKLQEELDALYYDRNDEDVTWEDLSQLKYMDCCIKETIRLYPPIPLLLRVLENDVNIDGHVIPRGVTCMVNLFTYHRNEKHFSSPQEFMPERFLTKEHSARNPYSYIPFSAGPRNCLGQRYAITELKVLTAKLFRKLSFTPHTTPDKVQLTYEITLRTRHRIMLKASRREGDQVSKGPRRLTTRTLSRFCRVVFVSRAGALSTSPTPQIQGDATFLTRTLRTVGPLAARVWCKEQVCLQGLNRAVKHSNMRFT
ncbi:cytochrome P450 4V2-like [Ornithodoros turicata]|uniref:cytochrome P450 4V2-like n=1 Tax=Ornithodoros turicata TaxID=34597 RepID=UPI003139FAB9